MFLTLAMTMPGVTTTTKWYKLNRHTRGASFCNSLTVMVGLAALFKFITYTLTPPFSFISLSLSLSLSLSDSATTP